MDSFRENAMCLSHPTAARSVFPRDGACSVRQAHAGRFEYIYEAYYELIRRICLRMLRDPIEAEDATQDVFLQVFVKLHTFRGESAFSSWLYRLATNLVLMRFRKKRHKHLSLDDYSEDGGVPYENVMKSDAGLSRLPDRIDLRAAIALLPLGYKATFVLHEVHGYDHREIAQIRGCSIGTSKSQLHRAREKLRKLLAERQMKGHWVSPFP